MFGGTNGLFDADVGGADFDNLTDAGGEARLGTTCIVQGDGLTGADGVKIQHGKVSERVLALSTSIIARALIKSNGLKAIRGNDLSVHKLCVNPGDLTDEVTIPIGVELGGASVASSAAILGSHLDEFGVGEGFVHCVVSEKSVRGCVARLVYYTDWSNEVNPSRTRLRGFVFVS